MKQPTLADTRGEVRGRAVTAGHTARALGSAAATGSSDLIRRGSERIGKRVRAKKERLDERLPEQEDRSGR